MVNGGRPVRGRVTVSGFKHSLVTVVAAATAAAATTTIENCPDIEESRVLSELLCRMGVDVGREQDSFVLDARCLSPGEVDLALADRIHGSVYLAPALLGRTGAAILASAGGCRIGDLRHGLRPVEHYASVFERFGARVRHENGALRVTARRLHGCEIDLLDYTRDRCLRSGPHYSGATKMAILMAAMAHGPSVLRNRYPKPDVDDLIDALLALGADIEPSGAGDLVVRGQGPDSMQRDISIVLTADLIEIVTWMCVAALVAEGPFAITGTRLGRAVKALRPEFQVLSQLGVEADLSDASLVVDRVASELRPTNVLVSSPGVFSDSQPFLALLATHAAGVSTITESVWVKRFGYLDGLNALGTTLEQRGPVLEIHGPCPPSVPNQAVHAPDLRSAAALLVAALEVRGTTLLTGMEHLARGYADLPAALASRGAHIEEVRPDASADPSSRSRGNGPAQPLSED